jgi:hypothetical protein
MYLDRQAMMQTLESFDRFHNIIVCGTQDRAIWSSEILLKLIMIKPMIVATIGWSEEDDLNIPWQKRKLSVYSAGISQESYNHKNCVCLKT